jgi:hypothetical protein
MDGVTVVVTESAGLFTVPSFTISCATYDPSTSAKKVGLIAVELESAAELPPGTMRDQL